MSASKIIRCGSGFEVYEEDGHVFLNIAGVGVELNAGFSGAEVTIEMTRALALDIGFSLEVDPEAPK